MLICNIIKELWNSEVKDLDAVIWFIESSARLNYRKNQQGRKWLSMEPKKLSYSDPESLHQVEDTSVHRLGTSLSNQAEGLLYSGDPSTHGMVASRRKIFETKGRALSASSISKTTLKQIQNMALMEYMERMTGHKPPGPQHTTAQTLGQRHSVAWQLSDSALVPHAGNTEIRKKLTRPLSAGRLLDDSFNSIRCVQCSSAPSTNEPARFSGWKEVSQSAPVKSASTEGCFGQPQLAGSHTSTPHTRQIEKNTSEALPDSKVHISSPQKKVEGEVHGRKLQVLSGQRLPLGKSMEGSGVPRAGELPVPRKSLEHLEQLHGRKARQEMDKRNISPGQREGKCQGRAHRKPFFKQESAPQLRLREDVLGEDHSLKKLPSRGSDWVVPPTSSLSPPGRIHSRSSPSLISPGETFFSSEFSLPLCPLNQGALEKERGRGKAVFPPSQSMGPRDSRSSHSVKTSPPVQSLLLELSVDDPEDFQFHKISQGQRVTVNPKSSVHAKEQQAVKGTVLDGSGEEEEDEGVSVDEPEAPVSPVISVESEWKELVEDVVAEDQSLARVLLPVTNRNTMVMLMEQLLSEDTLLMEEHYRRRQAQNGSGSKQNEDRSEIMEVVGKMYLSNTDYPALDAQSHWTSHIKDKAASDVTEKKRLLAACIRGHLQLLEQQRAALRDEMHVNTEWAKAVDALVQDSCPPAEYERYTQFIRDLERVVSLLLCLSARLARVQNVLSSVDQDTDEEEKQSLDKRHHLLCKQRDDAKELKENLGRREQLVSSLLAKRLSPEQLKGYYRFIQTKASLLIQQKDLDERQDLWEEQLRSLLSSIAP